MDVRFGNHDPVYEVNSQSGNTYEVDVEARTCSCPDFQKRHESLGEQGCKHLRRVTLEIRTCQLPQPDGTFQKRFSRP
jgi:predicted nucleic acid-binding Zn finger protein